MTQQAFATPAELAEALLAAPELLGELVAPLSAADASALVDHLKNEADRHWWINANQSLVFADLIVQIGRLRGDAWQTALGTMARGDALKFVGNIQEAWDLLGEAGALFESIGDAVGWARTRIGRMLISVELSRVDEALADAERAREVFVYNHIQDKLLVLELNTAIVYNLLGDQQKALQLYFGALELARSLGPAGERWIGPIHTNIGNVYNKLGNFRQAISYHEQAQQYFLEREEFRGVALAKYNSAHIMMQEGSYQNALRLLHQSREYYLSEGMIKDAINVNRDLIEIYLTLGKYSEARSAANEVINNYQENASNYQKGVSLLLLSDAENALKNFEDAKISIDDALQIFSSLDAKILVGACLSKKCQILIHQNKYDEAERLINLSLSLLDSRKLPVEYIIANILLSEILYLKNNISDAKVKIRQSLKIAKKLNIPILIYKSYLLLGKISEHNRPNSAIKFYKIAHSIIDDLSRKLTVNIHPYFSTNKIEALHSIINIYLHDERFAEAFEAIESIKSLSWQIYLNNHKNLQWLNMDAQSTILIEHLDQLRTEHQQYYRLVFEVLSDSDQKKQEIDSATARQELYTRERRMRSITEQLYLQADNTIHAHVTPPHLQEIQAALEPSTLLIEYYCDAQNIYAFCINATNLYLHRLPITLPELQQNIRQLQLNIASALKTGASASSTASLTLIGKRILQKLYACTLDAPNLTLAEYRRIVIVPSGMLHYLPFHLLHNGTQYLIESHEVTLLPAAGLLLRQLLRRPAGALALAHSWEERLPNTLREARLVNELFGGEAISEQSATRNSFARAPVQVLHIAAHGEHRLDQPDLSYFQLADGQVYTDDLFQNDLSYELVTLSACETGRVYVTAGDELIGLGRGFLYAGAASLITSLWRVDDSTTLTFMEHLYRSLQSGASKAEAIRNAQCTIIQAQPQLHPAFWGAFQLIGHAGPLSRPE